MPTLDWIGKKAVVNHHRQVPYRLIHCDKANSVGDRMRATCWFRATISKR